MTTVFNRFGEFEDDFDAYAPLKLRHVDVPRSEGRYEKTCPQCLCRFRVDAPNRIYCSSTCADAASKERKASERNRKNRYECLRKKRTRNCDICGKEYTAHSSTSKYCSDGCRKAAEKKRQEMRKCAK